MIVWRRPTIGIAIVLSLLSASGVAALDQPGWLVQKGQTRFVVIPSLHLARHNVIDQTKMRAYRSALDSVVEQAEQLYFERPGFRRALKSPPRTASTSVKPSPIANREGAGASGASFMGTEVELMFMNSFRSHPIRFLEPDHALVDAVRTMRASTQRGDLKADEPLSDVPTSQLIDHVITGNLEAACRSVEASRHRSPQFFRWIVDDRTARWAERIHMDPVAFDKAVVAVGLAHLCGDSGLPRRLSVAGFTVSRMPAR